MTGMTSKQKFAKFSVFVFLAAVLLIRLIIPNDQSGWIQFINYMGVCVACVDLYFKCYTKKDKFKIVTGIAIIILVLLVIAAALMLTNILRLNSRLNDALTIFALLLSLPSDLYAFWIKKQIER